MLRHWNSDKIIVFSHLRQSFLFVSNRIYNAAFPLLSFFTRERHFAWKKTLQTLTPPDTLAWSCPFWDLQMFFCWDHWHSSIHYTTNSQPFPWFNYLLNLKLLNIGFHRATATGVACWQGTLTPPDTWSCPTLGLVCVLMWDQSLLNLSCLRTFEFRTSLGTSLLLAT